MVISYINDTANNSTEELTWNKLLHVNLKTAVPVMLTLTDQDLPVCCEKIVRVIPKKRAVFFGTWNEHSVVIKLFYDKRSAKRHYENELAGLEALQISGVPAPSVLFHGVLFKKHAYVLVLEQITEAYNLDDLWQQKSNPDELISIMHAMTIELATQHVLGIIQHDLHFKNFLLKGNQIFTLDGGSIECLHELLPKKESLDHLALFFSQMGVGAEQLQQKLFQTYAKSRGWIIKRADIQFLYASIKKWNEKRRENYQKKMNRNSTAFARVKKPLSLVMYDRDYLSDHFKKFLVNPEIAFADTTLEILKAGGSSTVAKVEMDGRPIVVKRYNIKNIWHWCRRALRSTRAATSWKLANTLRLFGVATPKPIAFIEKRFLGFKNKSYFVMEYVQGPNLLDYFANYQPHDVRMEKVAVRVATLLKNITKMKMSHGDLKGTNILIANEQPILLDLDGMKEYATLSKANRVYKTEVKRFLKNWDRQPTVRALFEKLL